MIKSLLLIVLLWPMLSGCGAGHSIEQGADALLFSLRMPDATRVQFSSSVDKYLLHDTVKNRSGIWQIPVSAVEELKYFYVVDGSMYLPECQFKERDDFGSENCVFQPGTVTF